MERIKPMLALLPRKPLRLIAALSVVCSAVPSLAADPSNASTDAGAPPAPTHVIGYATVTSSLAAAVVLKWQRSPGATSYDVYMGTAPGGESGTPVATVLGPKTEIKNLSGFTTYYFTVNAHNSHGDSPMSSETSVTTGCDISCE